MVNTEIRLIIFFAAKDGEALYSQQKQHPVVDVTGDGSKVQCCIGTWNVRSMNQGKWEVVKQEMATHSNVLAWRIPGTGEPGGLPSLRLHSWT